MSSTNKTPNYQLSQFIGSDVPAWLVDYNGDMGKIDVAMKANDTKAEQAIADASTADGKAVQAQSTANSAVDNAQTAQNTANTANTTANANKTAIEELTAYLNLTNFDNCVVTTTDSSTPTAIMQYATNQAGTVGKVYGIINLTPNSAPTIKITTAFRPETALNVRGVCTVFQKSGTNVVGIYSEGISIATNGDITISLPSWMNNSPIQLVFSACLLFLKDFGDTPNI